MKLSTYCRECKKNVAGGDGFCDVCRSLIGGRMITPEEKYRNDNAYHTMVNHLMNMISEGKFTPSELREMVIFAATQYEIRHARDVYGNISTGID